MCPCVMSHLWHKWLKILVVQILLAGRVYGVMKFAFTSNIVIADSTNMLTTQGDSIKLSL